MAYDVKAQWNEINPETLDSGAFKVYNEYKRLYREMKAAREIFERIMNETAALPDTSKLVFGYNFGKLSVAIVPNDKPKAKPSRSAGSLADFLAAQQAHGDRA